MTSRPYRKGFNDECVCMCFHERQPKKRMSMHDKLKWNLVRVLQVNKPFFLFHFGLYQLHCIYLQYKLSICKLVY